MNRFKITFLFAGLLFFNLLAYNSMAGDTIRVFTHNNELVVTDPSTGAKSHERWGLFPGKEVPIRQITMYVRFACPDTMRCADWDYSDRIIMQRTGGVRGENKNWEIGRIITPYGGAFASDWNFTWQADVTDFSLALRDSVEVNFIHTGYEPNNDRGWLVTVEFEIVTGTPVAVPISVTEIYNSHFPYGNPERPTEEHLLPVEFHGAQGAAFARLRVIQTGHGMDKPDNCAEFCNKYREFWYDGSLVQKRQMWMECGDNPVFPQAGTWIFDRGNWCPGHLMLPEIFVLPVKPNQKHTIHFIMEPYTATVQNNGTQVIAAYLVQYRKPSAKHDAAVVDVITPTDKQLHSRKNPAGANPQVIIKNNGSENLRSLTIEYGTRGFGQQTWLWKGNLEFNQTDTVTLPGVISSRAGENKFTVSLVRPNGNRDQFSADNIMTTTFVSAPIHGNDVVVYLQSNRQPWQNSWYIMNQNGEIAGYRILDSLDVETVFRDTLRLDPGAYSLTINDTGGDGLEFWYNVRGGRGEIRLMDANNNIIKAFDPDFGSGLTYNFVVGPNPDTVDPEKRAISLYPTRTRDNTKLSWFSNTPEDVLVRLVTDPGGEIAEEHRYFNLKEGSFTYDLSHYPPGRFYLKIIVDNSEVFNKRIRYGE